MDEDNRRDNVAEALEPVLEEGDQFKVFCHEGKVYVEDEATSVCAVRHPRLYGRLLALNTQLEDVGSGLGRLPTLAGLAFCVSVEMGWVWSELGDSARRWWVYFLLFFFLFQVLGWISGQLQRRFYRVSRHELLPLLAAEKLDRDVLLSLIEGDPALERISHFLKLDAPTTIDPEQAL